MDLEVKLNCEHQLFNVKTKLLGEDIQNAAATSNISDQTFALVLNNKSDILLYRACAITDDCQSLRPILRWIPFNDYLAGDRIQAICFSPNKLEGPVTDLCLLIATFDCTLYIIPVGKLFDGMGISLIDIMRYQLEVYKDTCFENSILVTKITPMVINWWSPSTYSEHRDIAIIGGSDGELVFYSLSMKYLIYRTKTSVNHPISGLTIGDENVSGGHTCLLIINYKRQQWKLILEKESTGILINFYNKPEEGSQSPHKFRRFREFRSSVEKIVNKFSLSTNKTKLDGVVADDGKFLFDCGQVLLETFDCYGDGFFSFQQYQEKACVITGLFALAESDSTVHFDEFWFGDSSSSAEEKNLMDVSLTDTFIYVADIVNQKHRLVVHASRLSAFQNTDNMLNIQYNPSSYLQAFNFPNDEHIIKIYAYNVRMTGAANKSAENKFLEMREFMSTDSENNIIGQHRDCCLIITNKAVYQIYLTEDPWAMALKVFLKFGLNCAIRYAEIFALNVPKLINLVASQLLTSQEKADSSYPNRTAVFSFIQSHWNSVNDMLKLASGGYTEQLLEHSLRLLESDPAGVRLSVAERVKVSNLASLSYIHNILLTDSPAIKHNFQNFIMCNRYMDEGFVLGVMGDCFLFRCLQWMTELRGLHTDVIRVLCRLIKNFQSRSYISQDEDYWQLMSESTLVEGMLIDCENAHTYLSHLPQCISSLSKHILKRLWKFLEPTRPSLKSRIVELFQSSAGLLLTEDVFKTPSSNDENQKKQLIMFMWITNFLLVDVSLLVKEFIDGRYFNMNLIEYQSITDGVDHLYSKETLDKDIITLQSRPEIEMIMSAGCTHAATVRNGQLYTWGDASYGCLGNGPTTEYFSIPEPVSIFQRLKCQVSQVSCGKHHTLAITNNGVYAWGYGKYGQLGIGSVVLKSAYPRMIEDLTCTTIVHISAGQYHSLAVDLHGRLWSWGWGLFGQLGHSSIEDECSPRLIEGLMDQNILMAVGGKVHSLALTVDGRVWSFGSGYFGQLGIGPSIMKKTTPVQLFTITEKLNTVSTGYFHNLALSETGKVYTWGISSEVLNLLEKDQKKKTRSLKKNEALMTAAASESLDLQNANEIDSRFCMPLLVDTSHVDKPIKQISCGSSHSSILSESGRIYMWGRNSDYQLGNANRADIIQPTVLQINDTCGIKSLSSSEDMEQATDKILSPKHFVQISCGKDFTLALNDDGRIFGWGANNYVQLGRIPSDDRSRNVSRGGDMAQSRTLSIRSSIKRTIKLPMSHSNYNFIETPIEIPSFAKIATYQQQSSSLFTTDHQPMTCNLLFSESKHTVSRLNNDGPIDRRYRMLHYALECFHQYYQSDLVNDYVGNYQAAGKISCLYGNYYDAFYFNMRALFSEHGDYVSPSINMLKYFIRLAGLAYSIKEIVQFLKQCILLWIRLNLPIDSLQKLLIELSDTNDKIAYALSILFFGFNNDQTENDIEQLSNELDNNKWPQATSGSSKDQLAIFTGDFLYSLLRQTISHIKLTRKQEFETSIGKSVKLNSTSHSADDARLSFQREWRQNDFANSEYIVDNILDDSSTHNYIHISFDDMCRMNIIELPDSSASTKLRVFSCGHSYSNEEHWKADRKKLVDDELGERHLYSVQHILISCILVDNPSSSIPYECCCPKCLLLFLRFLLDITTS